MLHMLFIFVFFPSFLFFWQFFLFLVFVLFFVFCWSHSSSYFRLLSIPKDLIQLKYWTKFFPLQNKQLFQYVCVYTFSGIYYFRNWMISTTFAIVGCLSLKILAQIELPRKKKEKGKSSQDFSAFHSFQCCFGWFA